MTHPTGVHHIAISTANMKEQLTFFTQVLGMELVALYWMHGVEGAWHSFLKLNDKCSLSFVHLPDMVDLEPKLGLTHAANAGTPSVGGTLQHLSLRVETEEELLHMRDRIRAHGIPVFGAIDHGMCKSIYFAGPEEMNLEIATPGMEFIDPKSWIDPEVVEFADITPAELQAMVSPPVFEQPGQPVSQPAYDATKPHLTYPQDVYEKMLNASDEKIASRSTFTDPPVSNR